MSIRTVMTPVLASLIAAGSLLPMASAASARDFDRHGGGKPQYSQFKPQGKHGGGDHRWRGRDYGNHYAYGGHRRHRDHTGRNLAIGAFATILGIAIASEINRDRHGY